MQSEDQDAIFPAHLTLEEVQEAVHNMDEFKMSVYPETDDSDILFFNYRFCTQKTFPPVDASQNLEPRERRLRLIRRECRGLVFRLDKTTGQAQGEPLFFLHPGKNAFVANGSCGSHVPQVFQRW